MCSSLLPRTRLVLIQCSQRRALLVNREHKFKRIVDWYEAPQLPSKNESPLNMLNEKQQGGVHYISHHKYRLIMIDQRVKQIWGSTFCQLVKIKNLITRFLYPVYPQVSCDSHNI